MTETKQKERPILFCAEMVRATLEDRKTRTRRIVNPQPPSWCDTVDDRVGPWHHLFGFHPKGKCEHPKCSHSANGSQGMWTIKCPLGEPGYRLWVKETFCYDGFGGVIFRATEPDQGCSHPEDMSPWKPSIFMPRKASRLNRELTSVRVERLNNISPADAIAEGIQRITSIGPCRSMGWKDYSGGPGFMNPVDSYRTLWESINGPWSWAANPWVWVYEFKKL